MKTLREEHAQATRDAILLAARKLFTSKSYDASSIDEIAAAARVTSGALYHHFRNKRQIMRAVFEAAGSRTQRTHKHGGGRHEERFGSDAIDIARALRCMP